MAITIVGGKAPFIINNRDCKSISRLLHHVDGFKMLIQNQLYDHNQ